MTTDTDKSTVQIAAEKAKGKMDEIVAVVTGEVGLREEAEREQVESGAPDISATLAAKARKLVGRD